MTVKELKEVINDLPNDMEVIMQKDSEGNGYSPLGGSDSEAIYLPENTYSGNVYSLDWSAADCCLDEIEWEEIKRTNPPALILYPVN